MVAVVVAVVVEVAVTVGVVVVVVVGVEVVVEVEVGVVVEVEVGVGVGVQVKPLRHKYNARPTEALGRKYGSAKEAKYAEKLAIAQSTGALLGWMEQVPIRLPGKTTYRLDFLEFWANGEVIATEVKGMETPTWKIKKRQLAELYPWLPINVVTKV